MPEYELCPECKTRALTEKACLHCGAPRKAVKPKKKPAAKKVVKKKPSRKRGPKGRFLKD